MFKSSSKLLVCLAAVMLAAVPAQAYESFSIDNYSVEITVDEARVHHVREELDLDYTRESHGLLREIPLSSSQEPYIIDNVRVDGDPFKLERGDNVLGVRIGDIDRYVRGPKSYILEYDMVYARDRDKENDIVYVTPIGTEWDTPVKSASVKIVLPVDSVKSLTVYRGGYGSGEKMTGAVVNGNTITLDNVYLNSGEGLTFYVELPEGTFASAPRSLAPKRDILMLALIALSALMAVLAFIRWLKIGKDDRIVPTVEFYSPDEMNPAEMSYIVNNKVDVSSISAMIFFWASRGYMSYSENEDKSFELKKMRDMGPERPEYEQRAFKALFASGDTVTSKQIENDYFDEAQSVTVNAVECFRGDRALEQSVNAKASMIQMALCLLPPLLYGILAASEIEFFGIFGLIPTVIVYALTFALIQRRNGGKILPAALVFLAGIGSGLLASRLMEARFFASQLRCLAIVGFSIIGGFFAALIRRRTDYATNIIGRCQGFRDFLLTAEKDKLEALVEENPSYFFDTLPFAFVLGVTDVWAKKFEGLIKEPPSWYHGYYGGYPFTPLYMTQSVVKTYSGLNKVYSQRAVKNSSGSFGGGFRGGGFSGGGGGGGGGSAW